ncbi:DNA topoisomerase 3-alpha-like [Babylonia areolata]|uniref:DNA topoisomerase 3-alpha-like n=1 Tax=Babylonia areolata TaxID=304850 RepID=UPI003FD56A43
MPLHPRASLAFVRLHWIAVRLLSSKTMVRVLNVAEKNDAAKSLSDVMSNGRYRKREGFSVYNKIYEFESVLLNQNVTMTFTSVSGHLLALEFPLQYRKWNSCSPAQLFDAEVQKFCPKDFENIKKTLEREVRQCQALVIWTDCDREGENIGFEVIDVCKAVKPNIDVYRARFSEITPHAVRRAMQNLAEPDQLVSDAVDVRTELDLRIGAAFTRFQTLRLKKVFPEALADQLISYGSCQFPTLGFVVERYKQVQAFIPEPFWKLKVMHQRDEEAKAEFVWKRNRLFDHHACLVLYEQCTENPVATVVDVRSKNKNKWRPVALDTVELEKLASRKLRINAKETMKIAERLYTQGYISYPRTETNMFPKELDLVALVTEQTRDPNWGEFAQGILQHGPSPRNGNKTDNAHPPIHPIKYAANLQGNEQRLYEFIVRHFLACCSQDALGHETLVEIDIAEERFTAQGLMILAKNYLEVYPYDRWNAKEMPLYHMGDVFEPTSIEMLTGETSPPPLLTEADLIALMEKHGIGTDATHAEHIETIKSRMYVGLRPDNRFVPGQLGMGLVEGYDMMGYEMSKPHLRAELEADLKAICEGRKNKDVVLAEQVRKYKEVFIEACRQAVKLDEALSQYLGDAQPYTADPVQTVSVVMPCPSCGFNMALRTKKDGRGFYIGCTNYPTCRNAVWFPEGVLEAAVEPEICDICRPGPVHLIRFKFRSGTVPPIIPNNFTGCIGGCDEMLNESLGVRHRVSNNASNASGTSSQPNQQQRPAAVSLPSRPGNNSSNPARNLTTFTGAAGQGLGAGRGQNSSRVPLGSVNGNLMSPGGGLGSSRGGGRRGGGRGAGGRGSGSRNSSSSASGGGVGGVGGGGGFQGTGNRGNSSFGSGSKHSFWDGDGGGGAGSSDGGSAIVCICGDDAIQLTVRKEGPNTGRQFYKCRKPQGEGCNFFLWADEQGSGSSSSSASFSATPRNNPNPRVPPASDNNTVMCNCANPARRLTVQKEGPNTGREFYGCPKPRGEGCGFFQWADDVPGEGGSFGGSGGGFGRGKAAVGSRGRGGATGNAGGQKQKASNSANTTTTRRPRRCGLCGDEGHTKKTCPHRDS